jgi:hypothetical protein
VRLHCYCGKGFDLHYKLKKQLLVGFDYFCDGDCVLKYLLDKGIGDPYYKISEHPFIYPSAMSTPFDYWDKELKRYFRSKSESTTARCFEANKIKWDYEKFSIKFPKGKWYTPDFWLPEFSHFIEVKGLWAGSAKRKLRLASQKFNIILIPDYLIRKLERVWR